MEKRGAKRAKPCEDGQMAAKRAKTSKDGEDGQIAGKLSKPYEDGEDRLSALPDDLLFIILLRLHNTNQAARTSVLASRWRNLWRCLPEVRLDPAPDGNRVRDLLLDAPDGPEAPDLSYLSITSKGAAPDSVTAWLPAAARRLVGSLVYHHVPPENDDDGEEESSGEIQLPSFQKATKIEIRLGFVKLSLPSQGIFTLLSELSLSLVEFRGPCDVGSVVSTPRCPCLRTLRIQLSRGFQNLLIKSQSLLQIRLFGLRTMERLRIESPSLQELGIENCFIDDPSDLIADILAPKLSFLDWVDVSDAQFIRLGHLGQLQRLKLRLLAYGNQFHSQLNQRCLRLLRHFKALQCLNIRLIHQLVGDQYQYLLGDLKVLPQVTMLHLDLINSGHDFGATLFHLLRMCSALKRLFLESLTTLDFEAQSGCLSGCICEHPNSWKTEEIVLQHLKEVHIVMQGDEREVAFVQRLFRWATALKSLRITLKNPNSEVRIKEVREEVKAFSSPQTYIQFDISDDEG